MTDPNAAPDVVASPTSSNDNPAVVEKIQGSLDTFNDVEPSPAPEPAAKPAEPAGELAPAPAPAAEGGEKSAEATGGKVKPAPEAAAPTGASTLPAAYRRSAKARDWSDAEIDGFFNANPDLAIKTFQKMHESRVKEVSEWAAMGRQARSAQQPPPPAPAAAPQASTPAPADPMAALKPIDITASAKALAEKFGNEDLLSEVIGTLAGPLNAAIIAVQPLLQQAKAQQAVAVQTQVENLGRAVEGFFTSKDMEPFKDIYGTDKTLTPERITARQKVLEMADALVAGAQMQGRRLSVEEALALAHDATASPVKEKVIREQIQRSVTERSRGLTLRPTNRGTPATNDGPPRDRQELLNRAKERLENAFG